MSNQPGFTAGASLGGRSIRHRMRTLYPPPVLPANTAFPASWMPPNPVAGFQGAAPLEESPEQGLQAEPGGEAPAPGGEAPPPEAGADGADTVMEEARLELVPDDQAMASEAPGDSAMASEAPGNSESVIVAEPDEGEAPPDEGEAPPDASGAPGG